jgi:predicted AlkP superfamily pyrophosphatase or phosphodiesterase
MLKQIAFLLLFLINSFAFSQQMPKVPGDKPKLIVIAVVDQMRFDYLYRFADNFSDGGFNKLLNEGTVCKNAQHNYMLTQRIPGYVTLMSGAEPSTHSIVSDQWVSRIDNSVVVAGTDDQAKAIGAKGKGLNFSPRHLRTSYFSDELTLSNNGKSKVFSIALDGDVAAMAGGHTAKDAYWFDQTGGNWVTSDYYHDSLPAWVRKFNEKKLADIYLDRKWTPLEPDQPQDSGAFSLKGFMHDLINIRRLTKNYRVLKQTPFGNTLTKDFAISSIINDSLGADKYTDVLVVGFNAPGYINEKNGPMSDEIADTYHRLDRDIAHFLSFLDDEVGNENVLFLLTADRGTGYSPDYLAKNGIPSGEFDHNRMLAVLRSYLNVLYGKGQWIQNYNAKQIYLNHQLVEDAKLDLYEMQERIARFLVQFSGIAEAMPAAVIQKSSFTRGTNYLMQNSYHRQRSGDVIINLEPGWIELTDKKVLQNSGYKYDVQVPLIWYGWKMPRLSLYRPINTTDVAITISEFLEIAPPNGGTGEVIKELLSR